MAWRAALVVVTAAVVAACEPAKRAMPSFAIDVRPIMLAHCVRCHGAGGTIQSEDAGAGVPARMPFGFCYLNRFEDEPIGCAADGGAFPDCTYGAQACATLLRMYLPTMPPPPAELNDWERDVLNRWAKDPRP